MTERTATPAAEGPMTVPYIPGLADVPAARSSICFIDGEQGILEYRGYPIETLAEHSTFEETTYLLLWGKLPNKAELEKFSPMVLERYASQPQVEARFKQVVGAAK